MKYKNDNIANFISAIKNSTGPIKHVTLKYNPHIPLDFWFHIYYHWLVQIKKKTAYIWEYKVDNNANIANFVCLWKTRMGE